MRVIHEVLVDDSAQGLVEYSLILSLVVIVVIGAVIMFGESLLDLYETIRSDVTNSL